MKFRVLFVVWLLGFCSLLSVAQLPANMTSVKASQLSNDQLLSLIKQAEFSGQTQEDIIKDLKARGLPDTEISELTTRISEIAKQQAGIAGSTTAAASTRNNRSNSFSRLESQSSAVRSLVFGADLFSEASSLFVPNLNIATPPNYKVGPGDELLLEVYGSNVFSQKVTVSREGFINVKYAGLIAANGIAIQELNDIVRTKLSKYIPALSSGGARSQLSLASIRSITVSVVGAVKKPGTLTLPSLATLFNALYATGGPLENGSLRKIELIRGNQKIAEADLYNFLLKGDQSANLFLQDNDLIRVPFAQRQVRLTGQLNRTGIFEVGESESLTDLLFFAGGFKANAYRGRIKGSRNGELVKEVIDVENPGFSKFTFSHGDSLHVDSLVEKYSNRVTIQGAVYKPGVYRWYQGQTIADLIGKAAGMRGDAYMTRATVLRTYQNFKKESFSVNLNEQFNSAKGFELLNEDSVKIYSVDSLRNTFSVSISGPVKNPGNYFYSDSMTLQQLILLAGGFTDFATPTGIEIGRKQYLTGGTNTNDPEKVNIITVSVGSDLTIQSDIMLSPNDIISVKTDPFKRAQSVVQLSGEVMYPGAYVLESRQDRLSVILKRAGGLLTYADRNGAKLIRKSLSQDTGALKQTISRLEQTKRINQLDTLMQKGDSADLAIDQIALNLNKVLQNPNSDDDIILENGDQIIIPQVKNVVTVAGAVLKPVSIQFSSKRKFKYYVSSAGGFTSRAKKGKAYVVLSNGQSRRTGAFLGVFRNYPSIPSGSTIYIPEKPIREGKFDAAKAGVLVSAITALLTTFAILRN
jgi:protein involved in polysaccharide export with SLBB domain